MPMARTSSRNIGPYPLSAPYRGRKGKAAKPFNRASTGVRIDHDLWVPLSHEPQH